MRIKRPGTVRTTTARNKHKGTDAVVTKRAQDALDLRIKGLSYRDIAPLLGVSVPTAYYDVQCALAALDKVVLKTAERLRDLELRRLDRLQHALEGGIEVGDPRAILAIVRLMERRAKLTGLDAPTTVTGPAGEPVTVRIVHQELK